MDSEPRGYLFLSKENEALLRDTLTRTGVELGEYDYLILHWLAAWEFSTVALVASWVTTAAHFGLASVADDLVYGTTPVNSLAHDADWACTIESRLVSAGADDHHDKRREDVTAATVKDAFIRWFGADISDVAAAGIAEGIADIKAGRGWRFDWRIAAPCPSPSPSKLAIRVNRGY
jgi:hypothetical protein